MFVIVGLMHLKNPAFAMSYTKTLPNSTWNEMTKNEQLSDYIIKSQ